MSQEIFRKLRQMLMEKLDVYRDLTDQEILETIDELIVNIQLLHEHLSQFAKDFLTHSFSFLRISLT